MKHAFLIIAHNEYPVLEVLLTMLDDERNDIYLHIDKRSPALYAQISALKLKHASLYLIENPLKAYWGDISLVKIEYLLFENAYRNGPYAYYHLMSGVDLPLKSQDYIHTFFGTHQGEEFVGFWNGKSHDRDLKRKVGRYYLFTERMKDKGTTSHKVRAFCRNVVLTLQKVCFYQRSREFEFKKGSQWVSITHDLCGLIIQYKEVILRRFRYTLCPDEIFIQTLVWNSSFRKKLYKGDESESNAMRAIDWTRGGPYVWKDEDLDELVSSPLLFARKFSSQQFEVVKSLKELYSGPE
ncbi:MAG: beta-1,6-N-acetylglucosaminyltransferase [Bacteroidales bacterium]